MKSRVRSLLLTAACLMALAAVLFAVACGESEEATTSSDTAAASTTTAAAEATGTDAEATGTDPEATGTDAEATSGTMVVNGLVDNPLTLTVADLEAMNVTTITAEHPKKGATDYRGVLLSDIMAAAKVQSDATALNMGAGDGYIGTVTLAELDPDSMIAISDDGTLDAVMPGQSGKAWVSDIVWLEFQ